MFKKNVLLISIIIVLVILDLITKYYLINENFIIIDKVLSFTPVYNEGAAWGILSGERLFFIVSTVVFLIVMSFYHYFEANKTKIYNVGFILLIAGTLGNFIDRLYFGYVRDFIKLEFINFPVFNVADMFIVVGIIAICFNLIFQQDINNKAEDK